MQVACGNCQLSFDAPDGATGLICPICRGPLRAQSAEGATAKSFVDWSGGDLDDLIALLSGPAHSARVEVLPASGDTAAGEVHLLAGGVSDALVAGKSDDDALDKLRAIRGARFRIEPRLPNPADGDMSVAGPLSGTLEGRPLAHLMRYCEDYVITCSIEVWRGNETARVEYKRGEISGVTVGGIDAPERLAEVMHWASGNYRLIVPDLNLPATAPKRAATATRAPAPVPAPAPSAQAARNAGGTKTIFGVPMAEVEKARAAAIEAAQSAGAAAQAVPPASASPPPVAAPTRPTMPVAVTPPGVAPPQVTPPLAQARASATKTMFGVPSPELFGTATPPSATPSPRPATPAGGARPVEPHVSVTRPADPTSPAQRLTAAEAAKAAAEPERKTGARKVSVPPPEVKPVPAANRPAPAAPARRASAPVPILATRAESTEPVRRPAEEKPAPVKPAKKEAPVWTYVGVGFMFGLALLGIYQLVNIFGR